MALIDYVLQYARTRLVCLPLRPRSKLPLILKRLAGAVSTMPQLDRKQLEKWWAQCPDANIGIATGASGLVVLDPDGPEGLAELKTASAGDLPRTLVSRTGRESGFHFIYRGTGIKSTTNKDAHLDVRGSTGYIVAPPSIHPSGAVYAWLDSTSPVADVPAWVAPWTNKEHTAAPAHAVVGAAGTPGGAAPIPRSAAPARGLAARSIANLTESPGFSEAEADRLFSALSAIDAATDYNTWIGYGAALHDLKWIVNGTDEGFEIWDEWSSNYQGSAKVAAPTPAAMSCGGNGLVSTENTMGLGQLLQAFTQQHWHGGGPTRSSRNMSTVTIAWARLLHNLRKALQAIL